MKPSCCKQLAIVVEKMTDNEKRSCTDCYNGICTMNCSYINVMPINDLKEHIESKKCWCNPTIQENGHLIIHNSLDRRETFENLMEQ